jgi:hypothetical protein
MNATEILTDILLGGRGGGASKPSSSGGQGGGIFKDIFGSATKRTSSPPPGAPSDIERQARELEDMLGLGRDRSSPQPSRTGTSSGGGTPSRSGTPWGRTIPPVSSETPAPLPESSSNDPVRQDAEAQVLIRAMIHAAKADGRLTAEEQSAILERLGGASREAIAFLQRELNSSVDVRDFAWTVPLGLEYKVYAVSLAAIDLDTKAESTYLEQLAHGLRLPLEVRAHIHQRYGAPAPS